MHSIPPNIPKLQDDEKLYLGDDGEFSIRKSGNQLIFRDENNSTDIPLLEIGNGNVIATFDVEGGEPVYFGDNNDVSMSYDEENEELVITDTEDEAILMSLPTGVSGDDVDSYTLDGIINDYFVAEKDHDVEQHEDMGISHDSLSSISEDDHRSDENIRDTVDGEVDAQDADTLDGKHADDLEYTDSDARDAINNDSDHGSTADHDYFSGSHDDLSDVGVSDHRSDENIRNTVDGQVDAQDADTVDGQHAGDLSGGGQVITNEHDSVFEPSDWNTIFDLTDLSNASVLWVWARSEEGTGGDVRITVYYEDGSSNSWTKTTLEDESAEDMGAVAFGNDVDGIERIHAEGKEAGTTGGNADLVCEASVMYAEEQ